MSILLLCLMIFVLVAAVAIMIQTLLAGSPPMPSGRAMRDGMLAQTARAADTGSVDRIVELGSGWGGLTQKLASAHPDLAVLGIEVSLVPLLWSRIRGLFGAQNASYAWADARKFPFEDGDLLVTYLSGPHMKHLESQFRVSGGTKTVSLVSSTFALPGIKPQSMIRANDIYGSPIYLYCIPRPLGV